MYWWVKITIMRKKIVSQKVRATTFFQNAVDLIKASGINVIRINVIIILTMETTKKKIKKL